jgi:multiple sugar transport system permease protein
MTTPGPARRAWQETLFGLAWVSPWIVGFLIFTLIPVILSAYLSFCQFDGLRPPVWIGLENFSTLAADPVFAQVLGNTLIYAAFALPLGALFSIGLALLLSFGVPGQTLWRAIIFVPTLVPLVATAMIWQSLYNGQYGAFNVLLRAVGVQGPAWLADPNWTMPSMVLLSLWSVGHAVVIYLAALQDVPRSLYEAAEVDGAGALGRLRHVTLPMISPAVFFNVVVGVIFVWQVFAVPQIMIPGGGAERNAYFYTMYLYDMAYMRQRFGYACLLSWVQLLIILALTGVAFRVSSRLVHYRGATR